MPVDLEAVQATQSHSPLCVSPKTGMNKSLLVRLGIRLYHADSSLRYIYNQTSLSLSLARSSQASCIKMATFNLTLIWSTS